MFERLTLPRYTHLLASMCVLAASLTIAGQTPQPSPKPSDDVIRTFTELVQTDVMVFDKQGRFVNGLTRDQFELKVDGKIKPLDSFDLITAGSDEEAQLAAARGSVTTGPKRPVPLDRGRLVFFYVDDFHLDLGAFVAARKIMNDFVDKQMGQNDQAAITSATGQIGFLQQLTNERLVLRNAIQRLNYRSYAVEDVERPTMGVYAAIMIDRLDIDVYEFYISETIRLNPGMNREIAGGIVRQRASALLQQEGAILMNSLLGLERLVKGVKDLPGRKIVFFLSNGFHVQNKRADSISRMRDIAGAAAKSGVVIYTMDTRGLATGGVDISRERPFDPSGRLLRAMSSELSASQDGLSMLAGDTGGRFVYNTNDLSQGLAPAIKETSTYYLLAWKPEGENQKTGRFRNIQVNVIGRPDLTVRVRKGYFDVAPTPVTATAKPTASPDPQANIVATRLREAIGSAYPKTELPLTLGLNYYDIAGRGATVSTSVQMPGEFLVFGPRNGKIQAVVDLTGVYYDDQGKPKANFVERLVTTAPSEEEAKNYRGDITYTFPANLPPGLYQVRVAARDENSDRSGSAHGWIEVPDLTKTQLSMSSILVGERTQAMITNVSDQKAPAPVNLNPTRRFRRESNLRFLVFTYNATLSSTDKKPDIAVQVQVIRDDQPVVTTALRKVNTEGLVDTGRIPYAAEIPLSELIPGRYLLQVTIIDRVSKQSATRTTHFDVN